MSSTDTTDTARLLRRLARGLEKREALHSGAARDGLDGHLVDLVERLRSQVQETINLEPDTAPPRRIGLAFAEALYSQPHLDITFHAPQWAATTELTCPRPPDADGPVLFNPEALREVFQLEDWELDELRDEVDRRVGAVLKQQRAVQWLWSHFGLPAEAPDRLFRVLFPAAGTAREPVGMARHGAQLYAIVEQNPPPPIEALNLCWLELDPQTTFAPLNTFSGRYVDPGLRRALGRAIGAEDDEVINLLDRMVTIVPANGAEAFLTQDQWRVTGMAAMTDIGASYSRGAWLTRALAPKDLYAKDFFAIGASGRLTVHDPEVAFDRHAARRATAMLHHLYAEMLARVVREDRSAPPVTVREDLVVYDLKRHLRRVIQPLLAWVDAEETAAHVQKLFKVGEAEALDRVADLKKAWTRRAETFWWGVPTGQTHHTVRGALLMHLISAYGNMRQAYRRPSGARGHRDLLALFAAHYYAEASVGRLLTSGEAEDPVARWFWACWNRLASDDDNDVETTWSGPNPLL